MVKSMTSASISASQISKVCVAITFLQPAVTAIQGPKVHLLKAL